MREEANSSMNLSVVIPWCNRAEIARSLPNNVEWLAAVGAEVVIVSSASSADSLRELVKPCGYPGIRLLHIEGVEHFNKPECLNIGALFSRSDCVLTLDADIILLPEFVNAGLRLIAGQKRFATVKEVVELGPDVRTHASDPQGAVLKRVITTQVVHENGRSASIEYSVDKYGTRSGVGLVLVNKEHFKGIQGLNSNLEVGATRISTSK